MKATWNSTHRLGILYTWYDVWPRPANHSLIAGGCTVCAVSGGIVQGHIEQLLNTLAYGWPRTG